jgi:two-component system, cell cycle sensor histidine kinase and response regulator CckA
MEPTFEPNNNPKTILVVDDDPDVLEFVSGILNEGRYKILTAANGSEAVQQSVDYKGAIDLLLSDFQMPGMSGVEVATQMTSKRPELKVLLMSGFTDGMLVLNEGWHFLSKPFIPSQLLALIADLIEPDKKSKFLD